MGAKIAGVRVQTGKFRNKFIPLPRRIAGHQNVTPAKIKQALFQIIHSYGIEPATTVFFDLFAGTGQVGIEALSRNFAAAIFCEIDSPRISTIRQWIEKAGAVNAVFLKTDANRIPLATDDIIKNMLPANESFTSTVYFADPPYPDQKVLWEKYIPLIDSFRRIPCQENHKLVFILQSPAGFHLPQNESDQKEGADAFDDKCYSSRTYKYGSSELHLFIRMSNP